ncbi:hypothetical protein IAT40_007050 [Kwoniella sp. CBS 6097]
MTTNLLRTQPNRSSAAQSRRCYSHQQRSEQEHSRYRYFTHQITYVDPSGYSHPISSEYFDQNYLDDLDQQPFSNVPPNPPWYAVPPPPLPAFPLGHLDDLHHHHQGEYDLRPFHQAIVPPILSGRPLELGEYEYPYEIDRERERARDRCHTDVSEHHAGQTGHLQHQQYRITNNGLAHARPIPTGPRAYWPSRVTNITTQPHTPPKHVRAPEPSPRSQVMRLTDSMERPALKNEDTAKKAKNATRSAKVQAKLKAEKARVTSVIPGVFADTGSTGSTSTRTAQNKPTNNNPLMNQ